MPPLEALAADLLALLEGPAWPGTAVPHAVPAAVPVCASENSLICNDLKMLGPLGPLGPRKTDESGNVQTDEPTTHCHACGAPSWWLSPEGWCCAYCVPRPHPFLGASLVIADTWADGRVRAEEEDAIATPPATTPPARSVDGRVQDRPGGARPEAARMTLHAFVPNGGRR